MSVGEGEAIKFSESDRPLVSFKEMHGLSHRCDNVINRQETENATCRKRSCKPHITCCSFSCRRIRATSPIKVTQIVCRIIARSLEKKRVKLNKAHNFYFWFFLGADGAAGGKAAAPQPPPEALNCLQSQFLLFQC